MTNSRALESKRQDLLRQLGQIRTLRKGSLSEQWFPAVQEGQRTERLRGPYFVWTHKENNKTVSERVCGETALNQARQEQANYKRFRELCREYEQVAQQLGELERQGGGGQQELKKGLKSRSNKARKSSGS